MNEHLNGRFLDMRDFQEQLPSLLAALEQEGDEIVITRRGKPAAVVIDAGRYAEVQQALREFSDPEYLAGLLQSRAEIRAGLGVPADEVFRRKGV